MEGGKHCNISSITRSTDFSALVAVCGIVAMCRRVFNNTDGDRSPAGESMYENNFFALSSGEMPWRSNN